MINQGLYLPEDIAVDADLLRLFGYYMAEGNSVTKITEAHIFFTVQYHEMAYVEDVARTIKDKFCLDAKITLRRNNHMVNVIVNSANLARLFKDWFGDGLRISICRILCSSFRLRSRRALLKGYGKAMDAYVRTELASVHYTQQYPFN